MKIQTIKGRMAGVLTALAVLVGIISCEDLVEETPISELSPDNFYNNNNDALAAVIGIYDAMQPTFRLKHYYWGEFRGDSYVNGNPSANPNNIEVTSNDVTPGNTAVLRWNDLYQMINRANEAIANIPNIRDYDTSLLAEAHALRAYAYFQAIRVWGSVPLFTEPTNNPDEVQKPRTDATTILNEVVIPDMLAADELMSIGNLTDSYRFSKTSIWGLHADVYGFIGNDQAAKEALDKIVNSNAYSLTTSPEAWQNLFLNDNGDPFDNTLPSTQPQKVQQGPELIMSIRYSLDEAQGSGSRNRSGVFSLFYAGLPSFTLSPDLENKWKQKFPIDSLGWTSKYPNTDPMLRDPETGGFIYGDYRYYLSREGFTNLDAREIGEARLAKYNKMNYPSASDDTDIVLYRYAHIILYLAEIENRLGNSTRALELINQFRTARDLPSVSSTEFGATTNEREHFILDERQLELLGEGHRWWDLVRTNKALEILNPFLEELNTLQGTGRQLTQERLFLPIWDEHLIDNPALEQTPGY